MHEQIKEIEKLRHSANVLKGVMIGLSAGFVLALFSAFWLRQMVIAFIASFALIGVLGTLFFWFGKKKAAFIAAYKNLFARSVFDSIFENVTYQPQGYFSKDLIKNTYITRIGNRYSGDDLLSASYRGVAFQQCDLLIQHKTQSGNSSKTVTYFKGKWMIFDFHKSFQGYVQVRQKYGKTAKPGMFSDKPLTEKVAVENMVFNQLFDIRASDDKLAFYLLTPHVLESIMELEKKFDGQMIFAFMDGKLHIALNNGKNSMEPSLSTPATDEAADFILKEMKIIMHFIDELLQEQVMQAAIAGKKTTAVIP